MTQIVRWTRARGLLALGAAAFLGGCDTPASPTAVATGGDGLVVAPAQKTTGAASMQGSKSGNQSYDKNGYDKDGYDRKGYDKDGYDRKGNDKDGYDRNGCDKDGYDRKGYDKDGYDRKGYDKDGHRKGWNDNNGNGKRNNCSNGNRDKGWNGHNGSSNNCDGSGGGGGGSGTDTLPPPPYAALPDCPADIRSATTGYRCAMLQPYGSSQPDSAWVKVLEMNPPTEASLGSDPDGEANRVFPGWLTTAVQDLTGTYSGSPLPAIGWTEAMMPLGKIRSGTCTIQGSADIQWYSRNRLLVRTDITIPAQARNVRVQFLVDDIARVYINGAEVTDGWTFSGEPFACAAYGATVTLTAPASSLSVGGVNKIGVWADDAGGGSSYLDFRVFADVPIWP